MSTREDYPPDTKLVIIEDSLNRQRIASQIQATRQKSEQPQANPKRCEQADQVEQFEEQKQLARPSAETGHEESTNKMKCQDLPQIFLPAQDDHLRHIPFPHDGGAQNNLEPSILRSNLDLLPAPALNQRNQQTNLARQLQILAERKYIAPSLQKIKKKCTEFLSYKKRYLLRSIIRLTRKVLKELLKARQLLDSGKFPTERQSHYYRILVASPYRHLIETDWLFEQSKIWEVALTWLKSRNDEINKNDTLAFFFASQLCRDILFLAEFLIACRCDLPKRRKRSDPSKPEKHRKYRKKNRDIDVGMIKELKQIAADLHPTYANAV
ncbi:hypothetical protein FGO68_gene3903 [Halteria grandinella]|uniref:Uncharacterized protein n=1 Tax=Halteria grandinella TaxID=5974 RepID=A0A8J8T254_HALGN|nr:hypothetical protein FGO68_gene3903 [Halteria grandinella]